MGAVILAAILLAAILHAGWNALSKHIADRVASGALIGIAYTVVGWCALPWLPAPHVAAWPFIAASAAVQTAYLALLMTTYKFGDFSQTYPVARGLSPFLVSIIAVTFLGERLSAAQLAGIAVICAGLASMLFSGGLPRRGDGYSLAAATGAMIATYTLIDGVGVRHSGAPVSYAMWLFALQGPAIPIYGWLRRGRSFAATLAPHWRAGLAGGLMSVAAYALVVWAQSRAPLASVATLRETSVIFAGVLGKLMFGERLGPLRIGAACAVAAGVVAIAV